VHEFFGQATQPEANILQAQLQYFFSQCNSIFSQATTLQEDNELGKILKKKVLKSLRRGRCRSIYNDGLHCMSSWTHRKRKRKKQCSALKEVYTSCTISDVQSSLD
jgi:hypothetical protein